MAIGLFDPEGDGGVCRPEEAPLPSTRDRSDEGCVVSRARGHTCPTKLSLYDNRVVTSFN